MKDCNVARSFQKKRTNRRSPCGVEPPSGERFPNRPIQKVPSLHRPGAIASLARILQELWRNIADMRRYTAGMLKQYCRNTAGIMHEYCRNTAGMPQEYCRNAAGILDAYCVNTAVILQECCRGTTGILKEYCRNVTGRLGILLECCRNAASAEIL